MKSVLPTPLETTLEELEKFSDYTIRVFAFTSNGNGIPSEPVSLKTQEDGMQYATIMANKFRQHDALLILGQFTFV